MIKSINIVWHTYTVYLCSLSLKLPLKKYGDICIVKIYVSFGRQKIRIGHFGFINLFDFAYGSKNCAVHQT